MLAVSLVFPLFYVVNPAPPSDGTGFVLLGQWAMA